MTGRELLQKLLLHAEGSGAKIMRGRVLSIMPMGRASASRLALTSCRAARWSSPQAYPGRSHPGEAEFLGAGVSYCATCDGMLYRGKRVAVIGLSADAPEEAEFLRSIGCEVEYFDSSRAKKYEIKGGERVEKLVADGEEFDVSCVFILRAGVAPGSLVPGLELDGPHIKVSADMSTSVSGVFAAGDCVGAPYQVAKAAGEGNIAGITAAKYVENIHEEE